MVKQKENMNRYSEADLEEFKALIENKLAKATQDFNFMQDQIADMAEAKDNEGDWMDDTSSNIEIEMLSAMANRMKKHIQDLEFALLRIKNKTYGVCIVTGELIDKRRLLAVPATTKSVLGKQQIIVKSNNSEGAADKKETTSKSGKPSKPKIISKVIRKPSASKPVVSDEDLDLYGDLEDDNIMDGFEHIDLSDESTEE